MGDDIGQAGRGGGVGGGGRGRGWGGGGSGCCPVRCGPGGSSAGAVLIDVWPESHSALVCCWAVLGGGERGRGGGGGGKARGREGLQAGQIWPHTG